MKYKEKIKIKTLLYLLIFRLHIDSVVKSLIICIDSNMWKGFIFIRWKKKESSDITINWNI